VFPQLLWELQVLPLLEVLLFPLLEGQQPFPLLEGQQTFPLLGLLQHLIHMEGLPLFLGLNPLAKLLVQIAHLWQALQTE
jgi:hypothetical protein